MSDSQVPLPSGSSRGDTPDIRWLKMLEAYLPSCEIHLPPAPHILDIGCGNSVKWNYLAVTLYLGAHGLGAPRYVAVDVREEAFAGARRALGDLVRFVACDARNLSRFVTGTYSLALFGHPDLATSPEGPRIWRRIFEETTQLLDARGAVILTSFSLNDHIPAQVALERAGYKILHSGTNAYPGRQFDTAGNGEPLLYDKYILIARKGLRGAE